MPKYGLENIRNTVLLSHCGAGKTSLSEAILFTAGAVSRLGKVDEGSSTSDYDPDEIRRKISINLSLLPFQWRDTKINLIDTPGYSDFIGEVKAGMRVSEGAIIVICAASGVEVGTEQVWGYCEDAKLPRFIFINKMDRENADFFRTVEEVRAKFSSKCLPLVLPIGAHTSFQGIVNLLTMKGYAGSPPKEVEIPSSLQSQADSFREKLVEAIAEVDDALIEKYLGGEEISLEELRKTLRQAVISGSVIPILAGSSLQNVGINWLMDGICDYLPSPKEQKVAVDGDFMEPSEEAPLGALVFKTSADPYVGKLTYFRVYTGAIDSNSQVWNANQNAAERIGQLFTLKGKTQEPVTQVGAGDIGAVAKLNVTETGDTLCRQDKPIKIAPIIFPEPIFSEAVHPKAKADVDKMGTALSRLSEEDPTLQVHREIDTNETILSGMGDTHLDVAAEKIQRKFGVNVELAIPNVPYKETITVPSKAEYKHKKQTGGHGQYGHVNIELEPLERGQGFQFVDSTKGGIIPKQYIGPVETGIKEAMETGTLAGYPVVDIKATLYDGSYHEVDSSDIAFKMAGSLAFREGTKKAKPVLLEPVMKLEVVTPEQFLGDIIGDLNAKRGHIVKVDTQGETYVVHCLIPLAESFGYATRLRSISQGRATHSLEFNSYETIPAELTDQIIEKAVGRKHG